MLVYVDAVTGIGGGAQTLGDGQDMYGACTSAGGGLPDVEVHEGTDPVLFLWRRVAANTGGPGQLRGGQGIDEAYVLLGGSSFAGFASNACAEFPPPGVGGGLPPSTTLQYPIRGTGLNVAALDGRGQPLDEANVGGVRELVGTKVGRFVLNPGDVLRVIGGGGGGLGDPLLRAPQAVAADVRDAYITTDHARLVYGVVVSVDGSVDDAQTERRRRELRAARIDASPQRASAPPASAGVSVTVSESEDGRSWTCSYCEAPIAHVDADWRRHVVAHEVPIAELYADYGMQVRQRNVPPAITAIRRYCPFCASSLAIDVLTDRWEPRSPSLAKAAAKPDAGSGRAH